MKDFVENLLKTFVDSPDSVVVNESQDPSGITNIELVVAPTDMGKVIGKGGKIIKAIRDLTRILAVKQNRRVNVILKEG